MCATDLHCQRPLGPNGESVNYKVSIVHEAIHGHAGDAGQYRDTGERMTAGSAVGVDLNRRVAAALGEMHEVVRVRRPVDEAGEHVVDIQLVSAGTRLECLDRVSA